MRHSTVYFFFLLFVVFFFTAGCTHKSLPSASLSQEKKTQERTFAVIHVTVIPMTLHGAALRDATVIIRNDRIVSLEGPVPADAEIINGSGKWLMPGLIDMHVHTPTNFHTGPALPTQAPNIVFDIQDIMTPFIANGVTTIFNLNATVESFCQRKAIENGSVIGPGIALAALINGGAGSGRIANTPEDGRQSVRDAKAEGYEFIKLYSKLSIETFRAIVDEAYRQGMKTVGHIPDAFQGKPEQAFVPHFGMVAHAEEFSKQTRDFSDEDAQRFAQLLKANDTWLSPTLTTMVWILSETRSLDALRTSPGLQYVHPLLQSKWLTANNYSKEASPERIAYFEKLVNFHIRLVQACKAAGVPMVAGTDTGVSGVVAGFALHDELELLAQAGLTPEEVLAAATRLPAVWLGIDSEVGTVEPGKRADLLLLEANPLVDVNNTRKIAGVFVNGRWLSKASLDAMLADLSKRNTAARDKFDWKKIMAGPSPR